MEVREQRTTFSPKLGYVDTDLGVLPADWKVVSVADAGEVVGGRQRSPRAQGTPTKYLRVANVFDGYIDTFDVLEMPFTSVEKVRFRLRVGDILLNEGQSLELVGRSAMFRGSPEDCCFQNTLVRFRVGGQNVPQYLQSVFQRYLHTGVFSTIALQTTSIAHLGTTRFAALLVPLPPTEEQKAIAGALGDIDALIESLEQLLVKKRQIKQGAMQELLTGQRRLPGFVSEWHVVRLAELADIRSGGTPSTSRSEFWSGEIPWCTPTDITGLQAGKYLQRTSRTVSALGLAASSAELIPSGSIVMTSRATIGVCAINVVPLSTNQGFKNFVPFECVVGEFLYYLLTVQRQRFLSLCAGSTFLEIGKAQLVGYEVRLPVDKSEQFAIAATLSDMDAELAAVEARLAKTRLLKQGVAQALLTGRIRLV